MNGYARLQLAKLYEAGLGVEPDLTEALRWYRASADLGNGFSQFKTGQLLEQGLGAPKDEQAAARHYESAAGQGESLAAVRLAELLLAGDGVEQDASRASSFFEAAAQQGNTQAAYRLGELLIRSDPRAAIEWLLVAAHSGHALAQASLARAWRDGEGGAGVDKQLAKRWFQEAAERGNMAAQHELAGLIDEDGPSIRAQEWRAASAKAGYAPAQIKLAEQCQQADADLFCAAFWYAKAAAQGNAYAQYQMGVLTESGEGVPQDFAEARRWYALAANGDMPAARERLAALGGS